MCRLNLSAQHQGPLLPCSTAAPQWSERLLIGLEIELSCRLEHVRIGCDTSPLFPVQVCIELGWQLSC